MAKKKTALKPETPIEKAAYTAAKKVGITEWILIVETIFGFIERCMEKRREWQQDVAKVTAAIANPNRRQKRAFTGMIRRSLPRKDRRKAPALANELIAAGALDAAAAVGEVADPMFWED